MKRQRRIYGEAEVHSHSETGSIRQATQPSFFMNVTGGWPGWGDEKQGRAVAGKGGKPEAHAGFRIKPQQDGGALPVLLNDALR